MIYLTGSTNDTIQDQLVDGGFGLMCQPGNSYHLRIGAFPFWAADNGCFNDKWKEDPWIDWLAQLPRARCLFAVSPDVYPDAQESLRRGLEFAPVIREMGFPVAVVAQDGADTLDWPWEDIDCLFVGGEKRVPSQMEWKESAAAGQLVAEARNAGKWVHMGRVNSLRRLQRARAMGCHSVDGTFIKHGPNVNVRRMDRFLRVLANTPPLPWVRWETPGHPVHKEALR